MPKKMKKNPKKHTTQSPIHISVTGPVRVPKHSLDFSELEKRVASSLDYDVASQDKTEGPTMSAWLAEIADKADKSCKSKALGAWHDGQVLSYQKMLEDYNGVEYRSARSSDDIEVTPKQDKAEGKSWHWPCPHCKSYFDATFKLNSVDRTAIVCPANGCVIHPDDRDAMQRFGAWLPCGTHIIVPDDWNGHTQVRGLGLVTVDVGGECKAVLADDAGRAPACWGVYAQRDNGEYQWVADFDESGEAYGMAARMAGAYGTNIVNHRRDGAPVDAGVAQSERPGDAIGIDDVQFAFDLETLGLRGNVPVIAIAVTSFSLRLGIIETVRWNVTVESNLKAGMNIDPSTAVWWFNQDPAALIDSLQSAVSAREALTELNQFLKSRRTEKTMYWGNGIDIDQGRLSDLGHALNIKFDWDKRYWRRQDLKSTMALAGVAKNDIEFEGTKHTCTDDSVHQARIALLCLGRLEAKGVYLRVS